MSEAKRPRYITPEGFRRLAAEHERIWTELRPRIVAEVEAAAALGDRSENAEYQYGKRKLRELDRRLRFLSERMDALTVLEPAPHPSGRAYFGAWVTIEDEEGDERTYRLVGPDEFDLALGLLSVDAPLGRALLGKGEGDSVHVERPAGRLELTVVEPRPHPSGRAYFGAWVVVDDGDEERCYRLVGPDEADPPAGLLSVKAPLGRALLGKAEGDVARFERPGGAVDVTVVEVRWSAPGGEDAG